MSLPRRFESAVQYFDVCIDFLQQYHWLYNYKNTRILVENIFNCFPQSWKEELLKLTYDELSHLPLGYQKDTWPEDLKTFFDNITSLKPEEHELFRNNNPNPAKNESITDYMKGMSPKKQHEIYNLANLIRSECGDEINVIIDLGSGLGCLDQLLYGEFKYYVMGFESNEFHLKAAIKRQSKFYQYTTLNVKYVHHCVTETSAATIIKSLEATNWPYKSGICITGLHACADLTTTAVKLFQELHFAKKLIIMPCCYHKMSLTSNPEKLISSYKIKLNSNADFFDNFPLSIGLKQAWAEKEAYMFLRRPYLRLACQHSHVLWSTETEVNHLKHAYGLLSRTVLELFMVQEHLTMQKQKRKLKILDSRDFAAILDEYNVGYTFKDRDGQLIDLVTCKSNLIAIWNKQLAENGIKMVEILTALQVSLQRVCENLILYDKIQYLNESNAGIISKFVKITNDTISPRCYGLVASKPKDGAFSNFYCQIL